MDAETPQRVGDLERQAVVDQLAEGFGAGRLSPREYDERLGSALAARTTDELSPLVLDLASGPAALAARRRDDDVRRWLREWQYWLAGAVLLTGVWGVRSAAGGELERFWPGVPLGIWAVFLVAVAFWPADD